MTNSSGQETSNARFLDGFYKGKKVFVTGHTGFKGSWLSLWLHALGASVTGYALPPNTMPSHFRLIGGEKWIRHINGDINNYVRLQRAFTDEEPEIVFHLAAKALVREGYADPKGTFDTNIGGTVNVLEAIRNTPSVRAVVIVTSDKCYENHEWPWGYRENDPMGGSDPYSASKGATEIVSTAYWRSFFRTDRNRVLGLATARAGNVIGGGDWAKDRIIPDCVRSLGAKQPIILRNPQSVRPWQHVLDALSGYLTLGYRLWEDPSHFSGPWNFGPDDSRYITVREIAEQFRSVWPGSPMILEHKDQTEPGEASLLKLSVEKAMSNLKWRPVLKVSSAVEWTVAWYREWNEGGSPMRPVSEKQIENYLCMTRGEGVDANAQRILVTATTR